MQCQHTGIQIYIEPPHLLVRGDYHIIGNVHVFRITNASKMFANADQHMYRTIHGIVTDYGVWWDEESSKVSYSTMLVEPTEFLYFGFEGKPVSVISEGSDQT